MQFTESKEIIVVLHMLCRDCKVKKKPWMMMCTNSPNHGHNTFERQDAKIWRLNKMTGLGQRG